MAGITDSPFRRITRRFGSGLLYSGLVSAEGVRRMGRKSLELCRFHPEEHPIAIQLFGSEPEQFGDAAAIIGDRFRPDMIDINCGCPVRKIVRHKAGGYLMQNPDLIGRIVEAVHSSTGLPVSVKLRTGYRAHDETALECALAAEHGGAALVTVHARYVHGSGDAAADWDVIGRVKSGVKRAVVVGNGDVKSQADAERMIRQTGCDRVMIGRAALGSPWIFSEPETCEPDNTPYISPSAGEKIDILLDHYRLMLEGLPELRAVRCMRKHLVWYTRGMTQSTRLRERVMRMESAAEVMELLTSYRDEVLKDNND